MRTDCIIYIHIDRLTQVHKRHKPDLIKSMHVHRLRFIYTRENNVYMYAYIYIYIYITHNKPEKPSPCLCATTNSYTLVKTMYACIYVCMCVCMCM